MRITEAKLGMAPADYVTNCSDCRTSLVKARGDRFYHYWVGQFGKAETLCRDCAGHRALDTLMTAQDQEAREATAEAIRATRSH